MQRTLFFFTELYPYGKGESFIENEIGYLCKEFSKVVIVPSQPVSHADTMREIPPNASVYTVDDVSKTELLLLLPNNVLTIIKAFTKEFFSTREGFFRKIRNIKRYVSNILRAINLNSHLDQDFNDADACYYSYWMNNGALALSIRKIKNADIEFIVRVHGYDLYNERSESGIVIFQQLNCYQAKYVLPVSDHGRKYLANIKPAFSSKFITSHLGVPDRGINFNRSPTSEFVIVSCSFMHPIKRIHLIVEALMQVKLNIKWIHLGGGPEMPRIKELCRYLPKNISAELPGNLTNSEIIEFYQHNPVDLFIHLSETEGIPVAIMEAVSFGIPVLATDVGGVGELVNEQTGILVRESITPFEVVQEITQFFSSDRISPAFRASVKKYWYNHFNAELNYQAFINEYLFDND
ncbi:glycosyltransferase [Chitinophaga ginsengisegetis]|uniref:glycosyltransferase n=1 Tax=Chitinophaga ginsengisegetis TaxID=393003 RepID=UPI000DB99530|nr:glycosyltransferase [Chitinophaga ginsengisegetis]MDR6566553.1 glycosyltransferase involved in cell wall biosynthesis [Chitinophaga ginsengisegetis]MDR6646283.1 glycosyltransferase involved in cell wall biosynthesis [Chitinophaga ginsengisegetis]MDR6651124.1 glycosyltransferase involved in cell wall biosynthesis [Chitinophaga ginsengisegetis]